MKKVVFYQIQDGDTGAQVAQGLQGNFEALQQEIEAIPSYSLPIKMNPNSVDLQESAERFGVIRGDRKTIATKVMSGKPMAFTLADLGLDAKEDLNVVVMTDNNTWREELVAENN